MKYTFFAGEAFRSRNAVLHRNIFSRVAELLPRGVRAAEAIGTAAVIENRNFFVTHIPILPHKARHTVCSVTGKAHIDTSGNDALRGRFFDMQFAAFAFAACPERS